MTDTNDGPSDGWYVMGAIASGLFVWMGLWDVIGPFNAYKIGLAVVVAMHTMSTAVRSSADG